MNTWLIGLTALCFAGMGGMALLRPRAIWRYFGVEAHKVEARNEIRAVYGGFGLMMAGLLVLALQPGPWRAGILLSISLALLGMALGRLLSWLAEGQLGRYPALFLLIELSLAAALGVAI